MKLQYIISYITLVLLLSLLSNTIIGQGLDEVIKINQKDYVNSARLLGTGNAMGAIGGDFGAINVNPATVATFRRSYAPTVGIGLNFNNTDIAKSKSSPFSKSKNSGTAKVFLSNLGFLVNSNNNSPAVKTFNFAVTFNRVSNFNEVINFSGRDNGSIGQRWVKLANGTVPDNLEPVELLPAYNSYTIDLIDPDDPNADQYYSDYGADDILNKSVSNRISGGQNDLAISLGANISEKFLVGMNLSMPFFNYTEDRYYKEWDDESDTTFYESITFSEFISTNGIGFNFGVGAIIMPVPQVRIGVNYNSPTWYSLSRNGLTDIDFENTDNTEDVDAEGSYFDYKYTSPWSLGAQLGFIIGKSGFIDLEVEYRDHTNSRYKYANSYESNENAINQKINDDLGSALSLRLGGELAIESWRFRVGSGLSQLAYDDDKKFYPQYHAGLGYRGENYYFDFGYKFKKTSYGYLPYTTPTDDGSMSLNDNLIPIDSRNSVFLATLGFSL